MTGKAKKMAGRAKPPGIASLSVQVDHTYFVRVLMRRRWSQTRMARGALLVLFWCSRQSSCEDKQFSLEIMFQKVLFLHININGALFPG